MDKPIRSIQWVGDMSAPAILPKRRSPLSPEPGPVIKKLMDEVGEIEEAPLQSINVTERPQDELEETGTLGFNKKPTVSFSTTNPHHSVLSRSPNGLHYPKDKIKSVAQPPKAKLPSLRLSDTMMSGALPVSWQSPKLVNSTKDPSIADTSTVRVCRQPRVKKAPMAQPRQSQRVCPSKASCCSLRRSASSSQDFFTPPSTRFPSVRKVESRDKTTQRSSESLPAVREKRLKPLRISSGDSFSLSEYGQSNREWPVVRSTGRLDSAKAKLSRPAAAAFGLAVDSASLDPDKRSSLRSISRSHDSIPASGAMLNQLAFQGQVAKQSRATNKKRKLADSPVSTIATSSSHDFSSSLYSRPKSRVFRNHSKALDGGADAMTPLQSPVSGPRRSFSFEVGLHKVEALAEQRCVSTKRSEVWTGGKHSEITRLRTDNEALQQQMMSLREEFRTLKNVLLQAESHRR